MDKPVLFSRISRSFFFLPFLLGFFNEDLIPILYEFVLFSLFWQNRYRINWLYIWLKSSNAIARIWGFSFLFLMIYALYVIYLILNSVLHFQANLWTTALLYLLLYLIWNVDVLNKMDLYSGQTILKGHTTDASKIIKPFKSFYLPIILLIVYSLVKIVFLSLKDSKGIEWVQTNKLIFIIIPIMGIVHIYISAVVHNQTVWTPFGGQTNWIQKQVKLDKLDLHKPGTLGQYTKLVSRNRAPPPDFLNFLDENVLHLTRSSEQIEYFPFIANLVIAFGNWGKQVKDKVFLLHLFVLSQISQYRIFGLIPVYKRRMFYQYITVIAKTQSLTPDWKELLSYEDQHLKDTDHIIDWVIGRRWSERNLGWKMVWENTIYGGKNGYRAAQVKLEKVIMSFPKMNDWQKDIWTVALDYVKLFIGDTGRVVFSAGLSKYQQFKFVTQGNLLRDFEDHLKELEQKRNEYYEQQSPGVDLDTDRRLELYSEEEIKAKLNATMNAANVNLKLRRRDDVKYIIYQPFKRLRQIQMKSLLLASAFILLLTLNITIIEIIRHQTGDQFASIITGLEIIILLIISIDSTGGQDAIFNQVATSSSHDKIVIQFSYNVRPVIYAIFLTFYWLWAFR